MTEMRDGVEYDSTVENGIYVEAFNIYTVEYPLQLEESKDNRDV